MTTSPASDELEVTVFGPGYGECLVLHLGGGEWAVVDSCVEPGSRDSVAIGYLESRGVDVRTAVKRIIVSHWHDDHVRGLAGLVARAQDAVVCVSAAFRSSEFMDAFVRADEAGARGEATRVNELGRVFDIVAERQTGPRKSRGPSAVLAQRCLYRRPQDEARPAVELTALSPSDGTFSVAARELGRIVQGRRPASFAPNDTAVVLHLKVGAYAALLGSDLEVGTDERRGWLGVLALDPPVEAAAIYKVAHHGSSTGEHARIWSDLLVPAADAIVTPFELGRVRLPTGPDLERLSAAAGRLWLTSPARPARLRRFPSAVERTMREVAREAVAIPTRRGRVTVRMGPHGVMREVDGEAMEILPKAG
ncbi:MAG: MBL fold metallo-hydrolase [Deltaproteobacteria bacterium]|nr:MBL fold metallo-hydrolase [Deltaproteobacteria bacterium]